ncbi:YlmH/Sll1252 family protein, partial [Lactococcus lactis]
VQIFSSEELARTELVKIILAPDFYVLDREDFDICLLEINYASKFVELSHAQVLGTFLGQAGVKRQELGDIMFTDKNLNFIVTNNNITQ